MGFRDWLATLLGAANRSQSDQSSEAPPAADALEEEAAGLNFRSAIEAHQKWKARLQAVIDARSVENLEVAVVSRDDQCVLGKWIHGDGQMQFGNHELFNELLTDHASFHQCAGSVLALAQFGKKAEAQEALRFGDYARVSRKVVVGLAKMYTQASVRRT